MKPIVWQGREIEPTDSCYRCGLRRATITAEEQGVSLRLCDECYWGKAFVETTESRLSRAD